MSYLPHLSESGVDYQGWQGVSEFFTHIQVPQVVGSESLRVAESCRNRENQV